MLKYLYTLDYFIIILLLKKVLLLLGATMIFGCLTACGKTDEKKEDSTAVEKTEVQTYEFETFDGAKVVINDSNIVSQEACDEPLEWADLPADAEQRHRLCRRAHHTAPGDRQRQVRDDEDRGVRAEDGGVASDGRRGDLEHARMAFERHGIAGGVRRRLVGAVRRTGDEFARDSVRHGAGEGVRRDRQCNARLRVRRARGDFGREAGEEGHGHADA